VAANQFNNITAMLMDCRDYRIGGRPISEVYAHFLNGSLMPPFTTARRLPFLPPAAVQKPATADLGIACHALGVAAEIAYNGFIF